MNWPDSAEGGSLGDGRYAAATHRPETVDALKQAVAENVAAGYAIYPQGGRTALDYGGSPRRPGVAIDTTGLTRVIDYPAADMTITVEAGITLAELQTVLAAQHQRLLIDVPRADRATLGGVFATNTCGPRRYGVGRPRDQILGVSFVTGDAALVKGGGRVVKNVAGYDFPRLLTGSMGTLGILTQMTLKVRPKPETSLLVLYPLTRDHDLETTLERLNTSGTRPIALEVLNAPAAQPTGVSGDAGCLILGFEDNATSVAWQVERLRTEMEGRECVVREGEEAARLWSLLTEFQADEPGSISLTANLRPSEVARFLNELPADGWSVQAHAGSGVVRAHRLGEPDLASVASDIDRLRKRAREGGGNVILTRCPTDWKPTLKVWGDPRPDWALAAQVKQALDPRAVMNPGRFIGEI